MSLEREVHALRGGVALARMDHMCAARVSGPDAFEVLDAISPRALYIRSGQMLPTLLLDDDGIPVADVYICVDGSDYLVVAEGMSGPDLAAWLEAKRPTDLDASIADESVDHVIFGVHGPYAWELVADLAGPGVIGVPFLSTFRLPELDGLGLRAGKTGEFGYLALVPRAAAERAWGRLVEIGARYDAIEVSLDALDLCALENGFFCMRHVAGFRLTPLELQLGWRIDWSRDYPGADALRARRHTLERRLTWFRLDPGVAAPERRAPVMRAGRRLGEVVYARPSPLIGRVVGIALLDSEIAWPGVRVLIGGPGGTAAPPLLNNRSLHIDTQRHAYAGRDQDTLPPLLYESP